MAEHGTQAIIGWGSQLRREIDAAPGTYAAVTEVTAFDPPQDQADDIEVTHFEATNRRKLWIRGMIDSGEASCTISYNPSVHASHVLLWLDFEDGLNRNYQFALPEEMEVITFNAYLKTFKKNIAPSDALTADITFRVSTSDTTQAT